MPSPHLAAAPEPELSLPGWIYRDRVIPEANLHKPPKAGWSGKG